MKKVSIAFACLLLAAKALYAAPQSTVWQGILVDSNCYPKDHALTGNDHMGIKQCGTLCLKTGLPAGILTRTKQFHVLVAPSTALAPYVGEQVRGTGTMHNEAIQAEKVEVRQNGKWEEFKHRYFAELDRNPQAWKPLAEAARHDNVTLIYSSHDSMQQCGGTEAVPRDQDGVKHAGCLNFAVAQRYGATVVQFVQHRCLSF